MRIRKEIRSFCVFVYEWCVLLKPFYGIGKTKTMGLNQKTTKKKEKKKVLIKGCPNAN